MRHTFFFCFSKTNYCGICFMCINYTCFPPWRIYPPHIPNKNTFKEKIFSYGKGFVEEEEIDNTRSVGFV